MSQARVEVVGSGVRVTLTLTDRWLAQRLVQIFAERGAFGPESDKERRVWRVLAKSIARQMREQTAAPPRYRRVKRPPLGTSVPLDVDWVVNGSPPYPVLSVNDMRTAYRRLKNVRRHGQPLSTVTIARRLHVAPETVWRWERAARLNGRSDAL